VSALACGHSEPLRPVRHAVDPAPAIAELRAAHFVEAERVATALLVRDPRDARAAAVRAIATYVQTAEQLGNELRTVLDDSADLHFLEHERARTAWRTFADHLDRVDRDLAVVADDPGFSLELCFACWDHDWNHDGKIDDRDRQLLEIELDADGRDLAPDDPRRRPTFRFDRGDADWARAMVAFQRAIAELVLAYRWSELDKVFLRDVDHQRLVIPLVDPGRVRHARELLLAGLGFADRCRGEFLAETDDDREWMPNPHQHDHPVPLPVDDALYAQWAAITGDLRRLLASEEGLGVRELMKLFFYPYSPASEFPDAYIDIGRMLREPSDIVLAFEGQPAPATWERALRGMLGHGYTTSMRASPLIGRLRRMRDDLDRDLDNVSRKMRYLLWLN
jgi:hypothetical protein